MTGEQIAALALFAFVSSITPGPNNMMATTSGALFGLRRTVPQVAGVTFGFVVLLWAASAGVAALLVANPTLARGLAFVGYVYLAWLAWRLLFSAWRPAKLDDQVAARNGVRPLHFWEAAAFQFANPKAWMMALSTVTTFLSGSRNPVPTIIAISIVFSVINFPCVAAWALLGARMRDWLHDKTSAWRLRLFNAVMGLSLVATVIWLITL